MPAEELMELQMPHSVMAEQAVLGSILIDPRCVSEVIDKLRPGDFYIRQNREIYETIYTMFNYSLTIDPVTVLENMKQNGYYDENQSRGYILQLMDTTPTAANVLEYVDIVADKALLRRVGEAAGELGIPEEKSMLLQHMLLSHHGEPEFGAAVRPMCAESELLSMIDLIDSRMEIYQETLEDVPAGQFSKRVFALDKKIYRHS